MARADLKKEKNGKVVIGLWLNKETHVAVEEVARKQELTFSDIVRMALKEYVAKHNK
jgi:hypothetical protein